MKKIIIFVSILVGILLILQIRSFGEVESIVQRAEPENIFAELRTFQLANKQLRIHLEETEKTLSEVQSKIASETIDEEIKRLKLLSGTETIYGIGVEITFNKIIDIFWINDLITQLISSGAEAVSINNIRLIDRTAGLRNTGDGILMRRYFLKSPIKISAIGPAKEMRKTVAQSGGIIDRIENFNPGLKISIQEREKLVILSVAQPIKWESSAKANK